MRTTRRGGVLLGVVGWVLGVACALLAVPVLAIVEDSLRQGDLVWVRCAADGVPTAAGVETVADGVCVRHERVDRFLADDLDRITFRTYTAGMEHPRQTYAPWPVPDAEPEVTFTADAVEVRGGEVTVRYPRSFYVVD